MRETLAKEYKKIKTVKKKHLIIYFFKLKIVFFRSKNIVF